MPIYQIVISTLLQPTQTNPCKTIAEAMIDGSISVNDLMAINCISAFPENTFNFRNLPEGTYSSKQALMVFTRTIGAFLGHKNLYQITHKLIEAEITAAGANIFNRYSLAKCFLLYELERHAVNTPAGCLPAATLSHMRSLILPLFSSQPGDDLRETFNNFALHKIKLDMTDRFEIRKYLMVIDYYSAIISFDDKEFNSDQLSDEPQQQPADYPACLQQMQSGYHALRQTSQKHNGSSMFAKNFNDEEEPDTTAAQEKPRYNPCNLI